jgi:hypothetical protein
MTIIAISVSARIASQSFRQFSTNLNLDQSSAISIRNAPVETISSTPIRCISFRNVSCARKRRSARKYVRIVRKGIASPVS